MKKPIILITPGDPDGIGPEITWKVIRTKHRDLSRVTLLCVGALAPFKKLKAPVVDVSDQLDSLIETGEIRKPRTGPSVLLLQAPEAAPDGALLPGYQSGWAIEEAVKQLFRLKKKGHFAALATGPISKDRLQKGGFPYPGHTEFLAQLCNTPQVTMMLANDTLRVTLVTTHLGLHAVPQALTREKIRRAVTQTAQSLRQLWGIPRPRLAITALNPHAGESGLFGREEIDVIEPEIKALRESAGKSFEIEGPFPADTLFAKHVGLPRKKRWDAVVCMYHDQGLIPVKLLDFQNTVNVTLGLPIIRTSVDHGVGFDIAGKGIADPSSLLAAIRLAKQLIER